MESEPACRPSTFATLPDVPLQVFHSMVVAGEWTFNVRESRDRFQTAYVLFSWLASKTTALKTKTREKEATPVYRATLACEKFIFGLNPPAWANSILPHNKA